MEQPHEQDVERLYHAALDLDDQGRSRLLASVDPAIRKEVESLLAYDHQSDSLLAPPVAASLLAGAPLPSRIGQYRILSQLGEGGMGVVYKAEQERPKRIVALKIIRPGWCSTDLQRRFEREWQALGRLRHPGIAQIYEAGTADSGFGPQPYFAMELVHGSPLGIYLQSHSLDATMKLALIAKVCDAVHHAHQRGIIHRDLKPANILVDESGQPKILDFGVARITDADATATRSTELGQVVGTLGYMSPEQVLADPLELDIRTDVYSLGVILYELLAGRLPYAVSRNLPEAMRAIRESEPEPLGAISRHYRGDIETIVAKALEKEKGRRYSSAAELGMDILRHLNDEPVAARPPSAVYQLQKFTRRHRGLVWGASSVVAVLAVAVLVSTFQAIRADRASAAALAARDRAASAEQETRKERDRALAAEQAATLERNRAMDARTQAIQERNRALAEKRRADDEAVTAQAVRDFLRQDLLSQASIAGQAGLGGKPDPDLKVRTALDRAAARIPGKFEARPLLEAAVRQTIANAYKDLGLYAEAQPQAQRAVELRQRLQPGDHPDTLAALYELADIIHQRGDYKRALTLHTQVLDARRKRSGEYDTGTLESMAAVGAVLQALGRYAESGTILTRALAISRSVRGDDHTETADLLGAVALTHTRQGNYAQSESLNAQALEILQRKLGPDHPRTLIGKNNLAQVYLRQSKLPQAEQLQREAYDVQRRLLGDDNDRTLVSLGNLSTVHFRMGKFAEAESELSRVVSSMRRVLGEDHSSTLTAMNNLALTYSRQGRLAEATAMYRDVLARRRRVLGEQHMLTAYSKHSLAMLHRRQGDFDKAEELLAQCVESLRRSLGAEAADTLEDMVMLAEARIMQRNFDVQPLLREAVATMERQKKEVWLLDYARSLLGAALAGQKQYPEAEPLLLSGHEGLLRRERTLPEQVGSIVGQSGGWIVQLYREWGKPEQASAWLTRLDRGRAASAK